MKTALVPGPTRVQKEARLYQFFAATLDNSFFSGHVQSNACASFS